VFLDIVQLKFRKQILPEPDAIGIGDEPQERRSKKHGLTRFEWWLKDFLLNRGYRLSVLGLYWSFIFFRLLLFPVLVVIFARDLYWYFGYSLFLVTNIDNTLVCSAHQLFGSFFV